MARLQYDTAEALIYDPVSANRNATRSALYSLGFRRIDSVFSLEDFAEAIKRRPPDIAVCEAQGQGIELCAMIQALRQGTIGYNPFIVIIVTAWEKTNGLVSQVINSGADDLILRPFSTTMLGARIEAHVTGRKGFVITTDYVGPDRRRGAGRTGSTELFEPPNSLRLKSMERLSMEEASQRLDNELRTARDMLHAEKLRRDSFQVCILWRLVQEQKPGQASYVADLTKLASLARSVAERCRGTEFAAAGEWCESVLAAVEGLELGIDRNACMHKLGEAALGLHMVFHPEKTKNEHLSEIDATVAIIRARSPSSLAG